MICHKSRIIHLVLSCILGLIVCSPVLGQESAVKCELELEKSTVIPGEPIILKCKFTNQNPTMVNLDFKFSEMDWLRFRVVNSTGQATPAVVDNRVKQGYKFYSLPVINVQSFAALDQKIVLSQWVRIARPGKYSIKVHIDIPYGFPAPAGKNSGDMAYSGDQVLKLTVAQGSTYRLEKITQEWLKKAWIKDYTNFQSEDQKLAIKALFSIPEGTALPYWKPMILHIEDFRDSGKKEINEQLSRLGTPNALRLQAIASEIDRKGKTPSVQPSNQDSDE